MTKEEAIKVASEMHGWLKTDREREALETLIPELAESEDERIRKWIVKFVTEQYPECWKDKKNKMLAYLEKQKEQKPVVTHGETYHVDTLGTQQVIAGKMPQKPAEWSEEDEKMLKSIDLSLDCYSEGQLPALVMQISREREWLKSLRPQPKRNCKDCAMFLNGKCTKPHWKPSKEQMDSLCATIVQTKGYSYSAYLPELYEQLKKL